MDYSVLGYLVSPISCPALSHGGAGPVRPMRPGFWSTQSMPGYEATLKAN